MATNTVAIPQHRDRAVAIRSYAGALAYGPLLATLAMSVAAIRLELTALFPVALLFGWTQMGGMCGAVHVNTMGMLWRRSGALWFKATLGYTLCGLLSATTVGALLGLLGWAGARLTGARGTLPLVFAGVVTAVLAARECGWLEFRLLERRCQTDRNWMYHFGWVVASAMWGGHVGLGFGTVITYGGFWALAVLIVAATDPLYGALLMGTYWIGRALPLWTVAPLTLPVEWKPEAAYPVFRPIQAIGLVWMTVVVMTMAFTNR